MLTAVNTKILASILAALILIGGLIGRQAYESKRAADVLQQQKRDADAQKQREVDFWKRVQDKKKHSRSMPANGSSTYGKYVP